LAGTPAAFDLSTTVASLGCSDLPPEVSAITLEQLLHQIAGLSEDAHACVTSRTPLGDCACSILREKVAYTPPGADFAYGSNSFAVAAAIADAALARADPPRALTEVVDQLASEVSAPDGSLVRTANNEWAGLYLVSAEAYARFLALATPGPGAGMAGGQRLIEAADLEQISSPFGDDVHISYSPFMRYDGSEFRYGLGAWVSCTEPWSTPAAWPDGIVATTLDYEACPVRIVHSDGKFGFMPWIAFPRSPGERAHEAVLATYKNEQLAAGDAYRVFQMIEPLLYEILK
jgi:hypothetical protein